jgi:RNA polymerase sigma-70 factor (ECF subfamily)
VVDVDTWYREVYRAHADEVLAYLLRRTSDTVAHDLLSEVFLTVWRRRADVPGGARRRAWLYRVAHNVVRNHVRGEARRGRLLARLVREHGRTVAEHADVVLRDVGLRDAMLQLRPKDREVLRLAAWEDCKAAEIGDIVGCSTNAARIRLHRARRRLHDLLDPPGTTTTDADPARAPQTGPARQAAPSERREQT